MPLPDCPAQSDLALRFLARLAAVAAYSGSELVDQAAHGVFGLWVERTELAEDGRFFVGKAWQRLKELARMATQRSRQVPRDPGPLGVAPALEHGYGFARLADVIGDLRLREARLQSELP
jgi:hypothetical protein